ncbi:MULTISPECIES: lysoplasmalogenase [unclassified Ruegeria]|uniref:lysoplasmalogenase n=1 Tax=unclassified Ruegeria TaxID=2625375 RepID=UPI001488CFAD|nr:MULTISPECIES: lysoplasmalogenase [unclassified Ruegeria]
MTALFLIAAACALVYLPMSPKPASWPRSVLKTLSVAILALIAARQGAPLLLTTALALCAAGDALLSRDSDATFMAGIGAFAAGHLAYIALFLSHPSSETALIFDRPGFFWSLIIFGIVAVTLLAPRAGELKVPVLGYIPIILGMGLTVLAVPDIGPLRWALPAALAFIASDLILATEKFLLPQNHPSLRFTPYMVWILYWGAQAGLLIAFL